MTKNRIEAFSDGVIAIKLIEALKKTKKKGILSVLIYILSIPCAFYYPIISAILFVTVSIIWVVPDKNIEKALNDF